MLVLRAGLRSRSWCRWSVLRRETKVSETQKWFSSLSPRQAVEHRTSLLLARRAYRAKDQGRPSISLSQGRSASSPVTSIVTNLLVGTIVALIGKTAYESYSKRQDRMAKCEPMKQSSEVRADLKLVRYQGCVLGESMILDGTMDRVEKMEARPTDIFVASFPKSGTTWLQEVVYLLKHKGEPPSEEVMEVKFPYLEFPYPGLKVVENMPKDKVRLLKTHLPSHLLPPSIRESKSKVIYIYRNPKDVAVSYYHFAKMLTYVRFKGSFDHFLRMFLSDRAPYSPYFPHLNDYIRLSKENPEQYLTVCYEEMKENPFREIRKIAQFLDVPVDESEVFEIAEKTSFEAMKANPATNYSHWDDFGLRDKMARTEFMRKGVVGDHENYFKQQQWRDRMDEWIKTGTAESGVTFRFSISPKE